MTRMSKSVRLYLFLELLSDVWRTNPESYWIDKLKHLYKLIQVQMKQEVKHYSPHVALCLFCTRCVQRCLELSERLNNHVRSECFSVFLSHGSCRISLFWRIERVGNVEVSGMRHCCFSHIVSAKTYRVTLWSCEWNKSGREAGRLEYKMNKHTQGISSQ